jgi:hypothetical protein
MNLKGFEAESLLPKYVQRIEHPDDMALAQIEEA